MEDKSTLALYKSLKLTRNLINISFFIIFLVLLFWGNYNPAAAFTLIFYNALHWLLLSNLKSKYKPKKESDNDIIELTVLKFTFTKQESFSIWFFATASYTSFQSRLQLYALSLWL